MRGLRILLSILVICLCFGCATVSNEIKTPPVKINKVGYGFTPLNEPGWYLQNPNDKYAIGLVKRGETPNSTYAIQIWPEKVPIFKNNESFYDYVKSNFEAQESTPRFVIKEIYSEKYENDKSICSEIYLKALDKNAVKRDKHPGSMVLENHGYMCQHPENKDIAYAINYSHRYHEGQEAMPMEGRLQEVFKNFTFTDVY